VAGSLAGVQLLAFGGIMTRSAKFSRLLNEYTKDKRFKLLHPLRYRASTGRVVVPEGFVTDMDSVPRIPLVYAMFKGRAVKAAVIHDYLYSIQAGKSYADSVFLEAMKDEGVAWYLRYPIYWAVVAAGRSSYNKRA